MGSSPIAAAIVSFGEFEADLRSRELLRRGSKVKLTDQSFCVLAMLLEHPGELVTRDDIAKKLWPADTFVDFDHGLNNAVNRLREALGDSADSPQFIETLPRRGYRFIAKTNGTRTAPPVNFLETPAEATINGPRGAPIVQQEELQKQKRTRWMLLAIPVIATLAIAIAFRLERATLPPPSRTFILPPEGTAFDLVGDGGGSVALSADGTRLAFVAVDSKNTARIWVRELRKLNADALEGTEGASFPFWSPDGRWIAFFADGKLKKISLEGGVPSTLCDAAFGRGGDWNSRGVIIFAPASHTGIARVQDSGGAATAITAVDETIHTTHRWPKFLPDGEHFLYLAANHFEDSTHNGVYLASLDGKQNEFVITTNADATYKSGYLFFLRKDVLMAQRFDPNRGQFKGEPRTTVERVLYDPSIWKAVFDASENGVMAYQLGVRTQGSRFFWYDRSGKQLGALGEPSYQWDPNFSRDGKKLAFSMAKPSQGYSDVWVLDLDRGVKTRITPDQYDNGPPILTRDGSRVIFGGKRELYNIYAASAEGNEAPRLVLTDPAGDIWPLDLSPDGRFLLFGKGDRIGRARSQMWIYAMDGKSAPYRLLDGDTRELGAQFSPDGRWIAYSLAQSGREEVYVIPFHQGATGDIARAARAKRWQASSSGGSQPKWRPDGRELFYINLDRAIVAVPVRVKGSEFEMGKTQPLFLSKTTLGLSILDYTVSPEANKFLINVFTPEGAAPITIVENWPSDFAK